MPDVHDSNEMIARDMTLEVWENTKKPGDPTPEQVGERIGKLYKTILKNVREAYNQKYD